MKKHQTPRPANELTLTVRQTARLLRLPVGAVRVAVLAGNLPRCRRGLRLVVPQRELMTTFGAPTSNQMEASHDR